MLPSTTTWLPPPMKPPAELSGGQRPLVIEPVQVAGLPALAVGPPLRVDRRAAGTGCAAPAAEPLCGSSLVGTSTGRDRLGQAERVGLGEVGELGQDALVRAARDDLRQVRAERVEEVDEVVADRLVGRDVLERRLRDLHGAAQVACSAGSVFGASDRFSSACEQLLEVVLRELGVSARKAGTPAASAPLIAGSERGSSAAAGWRRRERSAKSRQERGLHAERLGRGGQRRRRLLDRLLERRRIAVDRRERVGEVAEQLRLDLGDRGHLRSGGASAGTRLRSSLRGLDRLRMTGVRRTKNGRSSPIVSLMSSPRPANASPNPSSALLGVHAGARRERRQHVLELGRRAAWRCAAGTVAPSSNVCSARPGISSTYLRPSAERGRTPKRVSTDSGSISLSSFRSSRAIERSLPFTVRRTRVMSSTTPTRKPPARTSLPGDELGGVGHLHLAACRSGTNGSPWFAL